MKGVLAAGADELVLIEDAVLDTWDARFLARVLVAAIQYLGGADLVLCGRQASDWDNAQVPLMMAEMLGWPCLTLARQVDVEGRRVQVERVLSDGFQVMEGDLPAVVTVTSELGELRYPTARARLQAARRRPRLLTLEELGVEASISPAVDVVDLTLLTEERDCRFVEGVDGREAGRRLAELLIDAGLVIPKRSGGG
jgi:electron transfer flavoprotein beta subunit